MRAVERAAERRPRDTPEPGRASAVSPRGERPTPAQALALQRLAGNRVTGRILARWVKHPDSAKKGVMVPDVAAEEFERFNPPQNK